jgi:thiol:disulfide interchange protein DsbA
MKSTIRSTLNILLVTLIALVASLPAAAIEVYESGKNFKLITPAQPTRAAPGKVEMVEVFWYGCPHCYTLEPTLLKWLENKPESVEFSKMPAQFRAQWAVHAGAYYVSEILGINDKIHQPLFDEIQRNRKKMVTDADMAAFFAKHGVAKEKYHATLASFAIRNKLGYARRMVKNYGLDGVPTIIINGKYRVSASMNDNSNDKMLQVVDYLIAKEAAAGKK